MRRTKFRRRRCVKSLSMAAAQRTLNRHHLTAGLEVV
jgi:hypothetical protein